jgi:hypothetical protein
MLKRSIDRRPTHWLLAITSGKDIVPLSGQGSQLTQDFDCLSS